MSRVAFFSLLLVLCASGAASVVFAHGINEEATAGRYTILLGSIPEQLEPGKANLIVVVQQNEVPVANEPVWIRLSENDRVFFAGTFVTDEIGSVPITYFFNGPGTYDLTVSVQDETATLPVHVHGQYLLLFGFLAAVFITFALLLEKL